jgi:glyoxylase-like metal-dependent hydrolase (beta-lactamase superfamily II)
MRAVSVHPDALVLTSRMWQVNAVALRAGGEAVLVDSPYFPDELELLPQVLAQAGFEPDGLLATHGDFDHVLGRLAYPGMALGVAELTAERFQRSPGAVQRELREVDAEFYVERPRPLALGSVQALPVPGRVELGEGELELHPAEGHTVDGMALFAPACGVLVAGDYLSDVELPALNDGGSLEAYRATLARLAPVVGRAETVVPGHGSPLSREAALRVLDEDVGYLDELQAGKERPKLPDGRDSSRQRELHAENLAALR